MDGALLEALKAIRDLRRRSLEDGWHPENLTQALVFAITIDRHAARGAGRLVAWEKAAMRGEDLAAETIAREGASP